MASDLTSSKKDALEEENTVLRELLAQAGIDAARLLAQAGIDATQQRASERLQRLLLDELHQVQKSTRHSFGTRLIDRLADQLRGDVRWRFEPTGVVCELDAPLISLQPLHSS